MDIRRAPDPQSTAKSAATYIANRIKAAVSQHGTCNLALAGGSSPKATYLLLREMELDWQHLHFWFGDERCLSKGDPQRNDSMAAESLFARQPILPSQLHNIAAELGAEQAAKLYSNELSTIHHLDIVLLGLGEDGHTASLFPDNLALQLPHAAAVPVFDAPKPPSERVSLSLQTIRNANERIFIATGKNKHAALMRALRGEAIPAVAIGEAVWFVDEAAFSG